MVELVNRAVTCGCEISFPRDVTVGGWEALGASSGSRSRGKHPAWQLLHMQTVELVAFVAIILPADI